MKNKNTAHKDCIRQFGCWALSKEERYLEKMAARGWQFSGVSAPGIYRFEQAEAAKIAYAVEYVGKAEDVAEEIAATCNEGWEFVGRYGKRRYWRTEQANLAHPSQRSVEENLCLHATQSNLTTLLLLNIPGTFYCLMYLLIFFGEGEFFFNELVSAETGGSLYLFGALLGIAAMLYFARNLSLIRKRLRRLGLHKGDANA